MMNLKLLCISITLCLLACTGNQTENGKNIVCLENDSLLVVMEQWGGHFVEIIPAGGGINPLSWALTPEQMPENNRNGAPFRGHFLCLGRWGSPSEGEIAAGVPHNGEPSNTSWTILEQENRYVVMGNDAPLDGLTVERTVRLDDCYPLFFVSESFTNMHTLGRVFNVVQHVTLGQPFLSDDLLVNGNLGFGFNQAYCYPDPHTCAYSWPGAVTDTVTWHTTDLRTGREPLNLVSTHLVDTNHTMGWVVAYDPRSGWLLGYLWKRADYPWLNLWNHFENGEPVAKGLEFGTTGIGRPYRDLLETDTRFHGVNSWEYIDAGEQLTKEYMGFYVNIGPGKGIPRLVFRDGRVYCENRFLFPDPVHACE